MWIERTLSQKLINAVKSRPAVLLTGARQTGKSSLLKRLFPEYEYITFDHIKNIEIAKNSPEYFINNIKKNVILDEIQYIPEILREIKVSIDNNRTEYGRWILTGSQQFSLMENISESLAGRIQILHLETLSAKEIRESCLDNEDYVWKGGYPELWANQQLKYSDFFESYIKTYVEKDLKSIINVKNLIDFRRFLKILSTRVGQLLNFKSIAVDAGVSDTTVKQWLSALQISGIIYTLPPYFSNIGKRLIKSPKIYFADCGLLSYLLGIESKIDYEKHPNKGNIWENVVFNELIKTEGFIPGDNLFFYRDYGDIEIDFLIEYKSNIILIESKTAELVNKSKIKFDKLNEIFRSKYTMYNAIASPITDSTVLKISNILQYNPLKTSIRQHLTP